MKQLETDRLILRAWKLSEAEDMYEFAKSELVGPSAGWKPHTDIEESRQVIKMFIESDEVYAIVWKENGKAIGSIGIHDKKPDENLEHLKQRELGFVLSPEYWGRGIMPEAVNRCVKFGFEEMNLDLIWCGHYEENMKSKRVIEKCGFQYKFIKHGTAPRLDDKKTVTHVYCISKEDYLKRAL